MSEDVDEVGFREFMRLWDLHEPPPDLCQEAGREG